MRDSDSVVPINMRDMEAAQQLCVGACTIDLIRDVWMQGQVRRSAY
jgi:hypothetical protein